MLKANWACEVGAGTGRITIPALHRGAKIHAVEPSDSMLHRLIEKTNQISTNNFTYERATMADFKTGIFDLIVCPFRSFQHIYTVEKQLMSLKNAHNKLTDHGQLVLDVFAPNYFKLAHPIQEEVDAQFRHPDTGNLVERTANVQPDYARQILHIHFFYCEMDHNGELLRTWDEYLQMRWFNRFEMEHLLYRAGFKVIDVLGDFDEAEAYDYYSGEMIFITRKMRK